MFDENDVLQREDVMTLFAWIASRAMTSFRSRTLDHVYKTGVFIVFMFSQ